MPRIEVFNSHRTILGESPLWSAKEQAIYWIDVHGPAILRQEFYTGAFARWQLPEEVGAIGLMRGDKLVVSMRSGFYSFDPRTADLEELGWPEPDRPRNRLNDGKVDRAGRYWSGSLQEGEYAPVGTLWRLDPDRRMVAMLHSLRIPNGICWSPDNTKMYFTDSLSRQIDVFDYDIATGSISNGRLFASFEPEQGFPDGATVDAEGGVWSACMDGGQVRRFLPDGQADTSIVLPASRVTSCTLGGPEMDILFVTTATKRLSERELEGQPAAGCLFAVRVEKAGIPESEFAG